MTTRGVRGRMAGPVVEPGFDKRMPVRDGAGAVSDERTHPPPTLCGARGVPTGEVGFSRRGEAGRGQGAQTFMKLRFEGSR